MYEKWKQKNGLPSNSINLSAVSLSIGCLAPLSVMGDGSLLNCLCTIVKYRTIPYTDVRDRWVEVPAYFRRILRGVRTSLG